MRCNIFETIYFNPSHTACRQVSLSFRKRGEGEGGDREEL